MIISKQGTKEYLTNTEVQTAAHIMAAAFEHHENMKNIFSSRKSLYFLFLVLLKIINREGDIFVEYNGDTPIGYLTFMNDSKEYDISLGKIIKYAFLDAVKFLFVSVKDIKNITKYLSSYSQKERIDGNNIHLMQAAIDPKYKGRGLMTELFKMSSEYYKKYDSIVLETSDSSNVGLYEHLGFEVVQQIDKLYIFRLRLEE